MRYLYQPAYRGPLKAVILDWAGTTTDYGSVAPALVFLDVFERQGVPITVEEAREPMGAAKKDHIREICEMESVAKRWEEKHGRRPGEDDVERMYQEFIPRQMEALDRRADLIPGTVDAVAEFRKRGLKVGSSSGYTREMMDLLTEKARKLGYEPDACVAATEVPAGRPQPWMCFQNAMILQAYPMEACVKIGDTLADIYEGLNAGMWTIGLAKTGNEIGLTEEEIRSVEPRLLEQRLAKAYYRMAHAGAHYVVDGIADVPPLLDDINARLSTGERP